MKRHWIALVFACLVGILAILPQLFAQTALGSIYQGYPFIYQANEDYYMARVQDVVDGHPLDGSPLLYEYKDAWPTTFPVAENIYALPSLSLRIPVADTMLASKFFLPALLFLLIYALAYAVQAAKTRTARWSALATALLITLGYDIVDYAHLPTLLRGTQGLNLPIWTRPINPISGALFLFGLLLVVWHILTRQTTRIWILGGVLLGLSIAYFFSWVIGGAIVGLSLLYTLYQKEYARTLRLAGILGVSVIVQIPYWYHSLQTLGTPGGKLLAMRNGAEFMHTPIINKFLLAVSLVYIVCLAIEFYKSRTLAYLERWWWFAGCLLLACWAALNEQVLTGFTVWPYHFVQYTIPLSMFVFCMLCALYVGGRFPLLWRCIAAFLIALSLWVGVASAFSYTYILNDFAMRQSYIPVFAWLNQYTPTDCVVLVDEPQQNVAMLVPAFTHCNTYVNDFTPYGVPQERILHNFMVLLRLRDVQPQNAQAYLTAHPAFVNEYLYNSFDQELTTTLNAETQQHIDTVVAAYPRFYATDFTAELKQYRIDYLLTAEPLRNLPAGLSLQKVTQSGTLVLYAFK